MAKKILIVSTVPTTAGIGGVTIHTQRLLDSPVFKNSDFNLDLFDYKKSGILDYIKALSGYDIVHIHISNPKARLVFVSLAKFYGKRVVLTIHGNLGRHNSLKNFLDKIAVKSADAPVVINSDSYNKALRINKHALLCSAFIPPSNNNDLKESIKNRISVLKSSYDFVYATNASRFNYDDSGNEIYGITFLINLFKNIKDKALVISDPSGEYSEYYNDKEIPDNIVIIGEPHPFYEVIKMTDGMIRATSTDGDSISIKEALFAGKDVIATDCVDRPDGVVMFKYGDSKSFLTALDKRCVSKTATITDASSELFHLYSKLLDR